MKYEFTDDMREISGLGGDYERCCRAMVVAGCHWLDEHSQAEPKFHGYKQVYGIIEVDNQDAKELSNAMVAVTEGFGATGAMHQAAVGHVLHIKKVGWDKYVEEMTSE
jgi:hypothetical protein